MYPESTHVSGNQPSLDPKLITLANLIRDSTADDTLDWSTRRATSQTTSSFTPSCSSTYLLDHAGEPDGTEPGNDSREVDRRMHDLLQAASKPQALSLSEHASSAVTSHPDPGMWAPLEVAGVYPQEGMAETIRAM